MAKKSRSRARTNTYGGTKIDNNLLIIFAGFVVIVLLIMVMVKLSGVNLNGVSQQAVQTIEQNKYNEQLQNDLRAAEGNLKNLEKGTQEINNSLNQKSSF